MAYEDYTCLKVHVDRGVAFVTIDHPPMNLFDATFAQELDRIGTALEEDPHVRVVVFQSADPEFFIAHADVTMIQQLPRTVPPKGTTLGPFDRMLDRFRTIPKATIGKIEGRVRGGGSEFVLALDMRFAALGRAIFTLPEVAFGIINGAGATQRLPRLVGRGRALEILMGCCDLPADLAERYGYINRALPPEELTPFVERLAYQIASFPAKAIALAKAAVNAAELPMIEGLIEEEHFFYQALVTEEAQRRMAKSLEVGFQTREVEMRSIEDLFPKLAACP